MTVLRSVPVAIVLTFGTVVATVTGQDHGLLPGPTSSRSPHECDLGFLILAAYVVIGVVPVSLVISCATLGRWPYRRRLVVGVVIAGWCSLTALLIWMTWGYRAAGCQL